MKNRLLILALLLHAIVLAQQDFLKPSDTLNKARLKAVTLSAGAITAGTYLALSQSWYADYPQRDFHFKNDNHHWLQVDKAGHVFGAYQFSRFGTDALRWSGVDDRVAASLGSAFGFAVISGIEVLDGYSARWGASWGDLLANAGGSALFISQELLWKEQRIIPKFSFHTTPYPSARPETLGSTLPEQILKDYNGQTYWLSANVKSFLKIEALPEWLNLAVGYGAEGMITAEDDFVNTVFFPEQRRTRQFYLSLDADLSRIKTKSPWLRTLFSVVNSIKIPAPAIELRDDGVIKGHWMYF